MSSWDPLIEDGFERRQFDDVTARRFIVTLGKRFLSAFDRCAHPAMRCDYFRLCYLLVHGGYYIDADDHYSGSGLSPLFGDPRLQLHPLCYDVATAEMVTPSEFLHPGPFDSQRTFYVNNNPLIAPPRHPVISSALHRATNLLLGGATDIQAATGPGNLTACVVKHSITCRRLGADPGFAFVTDWDQVALSRWPLSYRCDERNWRRWNPTSGDL